MISNGKNITSPQKAQVCVIGSGPAGITAAWELSQAGLDVILLDGGRELDYSNPDYYQESWPDKVKLYNGVADGNFSRNEQEFLILPLRRPHLAGQRAGTGLWRNFNPLGRPGVAYVREIGRAHV